MRNFRSWLVAWHERHIVRAAMNGYPLTPLSVADIPCGTGKLSQVLTDCNLRIVGGDVSAQMISIARGYDSRDRSIVDFVRLDAVNCPFKDSTFNYVITLRLMHRVPREVRRHVIAEAARISKDHVIISYGINSHFQNIRSKLRRMFVKDPLYLSFGVSKIEIEKEIAEAGLHIMKAFPVLWGFSREAILLTSKAK